LLLQLGVWNLFNEGIGYRIVEKLNTIGVLLRPMIFAWDSYYLPIWIWSYGNGNFFLHVSHHSIVRVTTRTKAFHDRVFQQLEELNLNPKSANGERRSRFCHPLGAKS
jgi:hypothetical protein